MINFAINFIVSIIYYFVFELAKNTRKGKAFSILFSLIIFILDCIIMSCLEKDINFNLKSFIISITSYLLPIFIMATIDDKYRFSEKLLNFIKNSFLTKIKTIFEKLIYGQKRPKKL